MIRAVQSFVQLAVKDPVSGRERALAPGQPWHILIDKGARTACGRSEFTVATLSAKAGAKTCKRCLERMQTPGIAARAFKGSKP